MKKVILSLAISSLSVSSCFAMSATESRDLCKPTQNQSDVLTSNLCGQDKTPLRSLAYEEEILYNTCSVWDDVRQKNLVSVESGQSNEKLSDSSSTLYEDSHNSSPISVDINDIDKKLERLSNESSDCISKINTPKTCLISATGEMINEGESSERHYSPALCLSFRCFSEVPQTADNVDTSGSSVEGEIVNFENGDPVKNKKNDNNDEMSSDSSSKLCEDVVSTFDSTEEKESGESINSVPLHSNAVLNDQRRSDGESATIRVALAGGVTIAVLTYCGWKGFEHLSSSTKTLFTDVTKKLGQNLGRIKPIADAFQFIKSKARNAIPEPESVLKKIASATGNAVYTGILALPNIVERGIKISFEIIKYLIKQTAVLLGGG